MLPTHTVTIHSVATVSDGIDNGTETDTARVVAGILFAPEGYAETSNGRAPTVVGDATLYGTIGHCDSDDRLTHPGTCCDGADFAVGSWQVVGGSRGWGAGDTALPIKRTATV